MIFYADDDADDLKIFEEIAAEFQVPICTFPNGFSLLDRLKGAPPEPTLIFLDINMPGHTGLQILDIIRKNEEWRHVPVIMFSTSVGEYNIETSLQLGATYYLPKSPDYLALKHSIRFVIDRQWAKYKVEKNTFVYQETDMFIIPKAYRRA